MSEPMEFSFPAKGATLQVTNDQNVLKIEQNFTPPDTTLTSEITNSTTVLETATAEATPTSEIFQSTITSTINTMITEVTNSTTETSEIPGIFENTNTSAVITELTNNATKNTVVTNSTTTTPFDVISSTTDISNQIYYEGYDVEGKTLYVVLGVIIVSLLLIIVILIVVYKRYKASRSGSLDCATDLSQVTVSNGRMKSY